MYNNEDTKWFNQSLFQYRDNLYGSMSTFEISISTNSSDMNHFSAPTLFLSIVSKTDNSRRFNILSYSDVIDLTIKLRRALKNPELTFKQGGKVFLKYNNNKSINVEFIQSQMNNEWIVAFEIRHNESDFGRVILPFSPVFMSFVKKLESFSNNCDQMSISMVNRSLFSMMIDKLQGIENAIKILPSNIQIPDVSQITNHKITEPPKLKSHDEHESVDSKVVENSDATSTQIINSTNELQDGFDSFMNDNVDNADVPELERDDEITEQKEKSFEVDSPLADKVLNWNLKNLENVIYALITRPSPFIKFREMIEGDIGFDILPDITEQELKTQSYTSSLIFHSLLQNYSRNNAAFPPSVPVVTYQPKNKDVNNSILATDLLLINAYIKLMRAKIEDKESDAMSNKAILHIAFRCFSDPIMFGFLHEENKSTIVGNVKERFKAFKSKGFFDEYDQYLKNYNLTEITENEITSFVSNMTSSVLGKIPTIMTSIKEMRNRNEVLLESIDKYSLEQIDEIVKAEIEVKLANYEMVKDRLDEDIVKIIDEARKSIPSKFKNTSSKPKSQLTKDPNIYKYVYSFRNEIPKEYQEKVLSELKDIGKNRFDWKGFPIEEVGDRVVIALYCWNNSSRSESYKSFVADHIEQCGMTKDLIEVKVKTELETETSYETTNEWEGVV